MSARRIYLGLSVPLLVGLGCTQLLGLQDDSVLRAPDDAGAGAGDATPVVPPPSTDGAPGPLQCNGKVAKPDDPSVGCAALNCEACSVPFANETKCVSGECAVATCQPGRAECDGRSDNGCEADLLAPETCGSCTTSCPSSAPYCGNDGTLIRCLVQCPPGQATCGKSCVDVSGSVEHCGDCTTKCGATTIANADPACVDSKCTAKCRAGQDLCGADISAGCGTLKKSYQDSDKDGYGVAGTEHTSCTVPDGFSTTPGDCADDNDQVHPGQEKFFDTPYNVSGGGSSYDYDCNGTEEEAPGVVHFDQCGPAPTCAGSGGYRPRVDPTSTPGNAFCGSTNIVNCATSASGGTTCDESPVSGAAVTCR
jgi:hypothetical protein